MPGQKTELERVDELQVTVNVIDISLASTDVADRRCRTTCDWTRHCRLPSTATPCFWMCGEVIGARKSCSTPASVRAASSTTSMPCSPAARDASHRHQPRPFRPHDGAAGPGGSVRRSQGASGGAPRCVPRTQTVAPNGEERRLPTPMRADFRRENIEVIEEEQALDASATSAARAVHRLTGVKVVQAAR
jgi:hypothetical protein